MVKQLRFVTSPFGDLVIFTDDTIKKKGIFESSLQNIIPFIFSTTGYSFIFSRICYNIYYCLELFSLNQLLELAT